MNSLYQLRRVRLARAALDALERESVTVAREAGKSWDEIALALDKPKATVHRRHR